jgi:hypothetical protein
MTDILSEEELKALTLLAKNRRLLLILVPESATDKFVAKLTSWSNFCLDTKLIPPLYVPAVKQGDGLICPYCGSPASQNIDMHGRSCEWRKATERWAFSQIEIDETFGGEIA